MRQPGLVRNSKQRLVQANTHKATNSHQVGGNQKRYQQSRNANQKSIETVFSIAICRQWGDKWQSKTLFILIFYLPSSIVLVLSIATYPVC